MYFHGKVKEEFGNDINADLKAKDNNMLTDKEIDDICLISSRIHFLNDFPNKKFKTAKNSPRKQSIKIIDDNNSNPKNNPHIKDKDKDKNILNNENSKKTKTKDKKDKGTNIINNKFLMSNMMFHPAKKYKSQINSRSNSNMKKDCKDKKKDIDKEDTQKNNNNQNSGAKNHLNYSGKNEINRIYIENLINQSKKRKYFHQSNLSNLLFSNKEKDNFMPNKYLSKQISPRNGSSSLKKEKQPEIELDSSYLKKYLKSHNDNNKNKTGKEVNFKITNNSKPKNMEDKTNKGSSNIKIDSNNHKKNIFKKEVEPNLNFNKVKISDLGFDFSLLAKNISKSTMQTKKNSRVNSLEKHSNKNSCKSSKIILEQSNNNSKTKNSNKKPNSSKNSFSVLFKNQKEEKNEKQNNNKKGATGLSFNNNISEINSANSKNQLSLSNSLLNFNFKNLFKISLKKNQKKENISLNKNKKTNDISRIDKSNAHSKKKNLLMPNSNSLDYQYKINEKDIFKAKIKLKNKVNYHMASAKSKQCSSKSSSIIDDCSNAKNHKSKHSTNCSKDFQKLSSKPLDKKFTNFLNYNFSKDAGEYSNNNQSIKNINSKQHSKQNSANKSKQIHFSNKKIIELDSFKKHLNNNFLKISKNTPSFGIETLYKKNIDTIESINSTLRDNFYYKNEMIKISNYLKKFYLTHQIYPKTKLEFYKYGRVIGRGAFGKVNLALHICSGRLVAIKSFNLKKIQKNGTSKKINYEIEIMKILHCPFITQILDSFESETHLFIVMEYVCGDLYSFIRKRGKLNENYGKIIFKQIIEGLKYLHSRNIVHRDIKLDNILFDLTNTVKICDFGVSRKIKQGQILHERCGTPAYIAPEIFTEEGYEGFPCDIWSAGVTLYYLMSGSQPFKAESLRALKQEIKLGKFEKLSKVSNELNDLLDNMLQVDPKKRITISQILNHPWLNNVNISNRSTKQILLGKFDIDYLSSPTEELIENFSTKNLLTNEEENKNNNNSHSLILAPFNTHESDEINHLDSELELENNICYLSKKVKQENLKYELNNNEDFDNGIIITQSHQENEDISLTKSINSVRICENSPNHKSENSLVLDEKESSNNNDQISIKIISNKKEENIGEKEENNCEEEENNLSNNGKTEYLQEQTKEGTSSLLNDNYNTVVLNELLIKEIENNVGYDKTYLTNCIKNREVNYATATYYLLNKENLQILDQ